MATNDVYDAIKEHLSGSEEKPPKRIKHIITRKVHGGHLHTHVHDHPAHPDEEHVTQGTDGMVDHLLQHNSEPNPGEAEADAGQSGIPPQGGAPMPNPAAGAVA